MLAMDDDSILVYDFMKQQTVGDRKELHEEGSDIELTCMHSIDQSNQ